MRKTVILLLAFVLFGVNQAQATDLRALNVQNAKIYADDDQNAELRVGFDWFRDHFGRPTGVGGAPVHSRTSTYNLPRVDIRQACTSCPIPFRIGLNTALSAGATELETGGTEFFERSAFGFGNLGLTLEAAVIQEDHGAMNLYINQHFPWIHNDLLVSNTYRPINGVNAYGFQVGSLYQFDLGSHLTWYGDVGYRFDIPKRGSTQHSLVYYNEAVMGFGDEHNFGLSLGLLGNSVYTNGIGTDLRLVPGMIVKLGESGQLRAGFPIGLNPDSPDFGVQVSYFTSF